MRGLNLSRSGRPKTHVRIHDKRLNNICTDFIIGRTRIFWSSIGFIASIIFALVIFYRFRPASATHNPAADLDFASRAHINEADLPEIAKEAMLGTPSCSSRPNPITTNIASVPTEDERLRVFDEL
jgi:hypothetical protein